MYNMTTTRRVSNYDGLRRKPPMEELVSYLANHQETTRFPDREAKQIRNHPYMTQLDFFDMQDEQQRAWEEQNRQEAETSCSRSGHLVSLRGCRR